MRASKFPLAGSYLLLLSLLAAAGYVAIRGATNKQNVPTLIKSQLYTPISSDVKISISSTALADVTSTLHSPTSEPGKPPGLTPTINSNAPLEPYPSPSLSLPAIEESVGSTPYPGPNSTIPNQTQQLFAYPGEGTELPLVTQQFFGAQATPTAISSAATLSTAVPIDPTLLGNSFPNTLTPIAIATQGVIRTEIQVSDPRTFQIVSGRMQFVEIFAYWSPISKSMAPVVNVLADRYKDHFNFVFLDIDAPENGIYNALLNNRLPPIFFIISPQGSVLNVWDGYVPSDELERALQTTLP